MTKENLTIWKDVPVLYKAKEHHAKRSGQKKFKHSTGFGIFYGETPVGQINSITGQWEECINHRGNAYAARKRLKFRRNKKREL